jgi:hypothetical protein
MLAAVGGIATLAVLFMIFWVFSWESLWIPLLAGSRRYYAILGGTGLALIASGIGFLVGFNSAGQRRNTKSSLAWMGFFLNSAVIALAACTFVFFWFFKFVVNR